MVGGLPIRGPDSVVSEKSDEAGSAVLRATHDGYLKRFGLLHSRRLALSPAGDVLEGVDTLRPPKGQLRLKQDLPYAIHFHLHPSCRCTSSEPGSSRIELADGEVWIFSADDAALSIEESLFFVDSAGPRPGLQIVLRGTTFGETEVRWRVRLQGAAELV
jgi:uncharacterized heparinase superfamily protein